MTKRIGDLPPEVVGEKILSKVPLTSLIEVRSTCKLWESLSREWILGKAVAQQQFMGFMTMDSRVCSLVFQLRKDEGLVDLCIKQVDLLNKVEISEVFQCDGLLLCVTKDKSRLVAWNPYLGQTRWITPRTRFHRVDKYALGYDVKNGNHKILRVLDIYEHKHLLEFEMYDFSSNSWRVIEVTPDWAVDSHQRGASLKGNTYFFAHDRLRDLLDPKPQKRRIDYFLLCFDFTRERFGPHLPLPFHSWCESVSTVSLSCVREEQLAVLYQHGDGRAVPYDGLEVWVTTMIEPNTVSWSKFLNVNTRALTSHVGARFDLLYGSFFIDEEQKVAVVFDKDGFIQTEMPRYHTAFLIGEDGYFKSVSLGDAPNVYVPKTATPPGGYIRKFYTPPLVCSSSYLPSLVQLNQPPKRKETEWIFLNRFLQI